MQLGEINKKADDTQAKLVFLVADKFLKRSGEPIGIIDEVSAVVDCDVDFVAVVENLVFFQKHNLAKIEHFVKLADELR